MNAGISAPPRLTRVLEAVFWTCSAILAAAIAAAGAWAVHHGYGDWHPMADVWTRIGTRALLNPPERWQTFAYLPATVFLLAPFASLPMRAGFIANAVFMTFCAGVAGWVAAAVYQLPKRVSIGLFLSWPPALYAAAIMGQNASFGLLATMLSIAGTAAQSPLLTALPIGLLLYKPTYALPLIGALVVRRAWRECGIVGLCAAAWYLLSVVATGNDWWWPSTWWHLIAMYAPGDWSYNGPLTISATTTFGRLGVQVDVLVPIVLAVTVLGCVAIARSSPVEAATGAMLLGLAWSPHAWAYDATLALPMIALALGRFNRNLRIYALCALLVIAPLFFLSRDLGFDPLLLITVGGSTIWIAAVLVRRQRQGGPVLLSSANEVCP